MFNIIAAVDNNWGISRGGKLPWSKTPAGKEDMTRFKKMTIGGIVIMGRKTWESLPEKARPLRGRTNIILSHTYPEFTIIGALSNEPIIYMNDFDRAVDYATSNPRGKHSGPIIIGGAEIYARALIHPYCAQVWITQFYDDYNCDLRFPRELFPSASKNVCRTEYNGFSIEKYDFNNQDEEKYLDLLRDILNAPERPNRTGIPTRSLFARNLTFDLHRCRVSGECDNILPMLTVKKLSFNMIYHELIWFLRGSTEISYLTDNGVHIWDDNTSAEFLRAQGLKYHRAGELGSGYGYQWRKFGKQYIPANASHLKECPTCAETCNGVDQIANVVRLLKSDPWSRRILVSAWNVSQLNTMALPPCHYSFQFYVEPDVQGCPKYLNCLVNMRSGDIPLGLPWNITSYSLLTHMIAHVVGLTAGKLCIMICDAHIYKSHIDSVKKMLSRLPRRFPTLTFSENILSRKDITIDDFAYKFTPEDYIITGYAPHPFIKMDMVV